MRITELRKKVGGMDMYIRDLHIERGGVHGLIGPNGCGKTSLLKMIMGITRPERKPLSDNADPDAPALPESEAGSSAFGAEEPPSSAIVSRPALTSVPVRNTAGSSLSSVMTMTVTRG